MERIYSLTDLARRTSEIIDTALVGGSPVVVAGRGRGEVVVMPRDEYLGLLHALDEMRRPDWERTWNQANSEVEAGVGKEWSDVKQARSKRSKAASKRRERRRS